MAEVVVLRAGGSGSTSALQTRKLRYERTRLQLDAPPLAAKAIQRLGKPTDVLLFESLVVRAVGLSRLRRTA